MKRLVLAFALAASIITATPVVLPEQASQASASIPIGTVVYRKQFPFIIEYTLCPGGWVITNMWYDMSIGF